MHRSKVTKESTLSQLEVKSSGVVVDIKADQRVIARLSGLGVSIGVKISVLDNRGSGPMLVKVRNTKIAFGRKDADRIIINLL